MELSPGGGWYTEILAPYLRDNGKLIAAHHNPSKGDYYKRSRERYDTKIAANTIYDKVEIVDLLGEYGPQGSADLVMTFRNLHNWIGGEDVDKVLAASFKVLKSGGMLGVGSPGKARNIARRHAFFRLYDRSLCHRIN